MTALEVSNISVRFGGVTALDSVSFGLRAGELLGLIGPNGAGKSTMMRVITGVVRPDTGDVALAGQTLQGMSVDARVRRGLGLSQQLVKPFRSMSLRDNVALAAGYRKTRSPRTAFGTTRRRNERQRATELLARVGIDAMADAMPDDVPLGVRKRLELARALALEPRILLLDEPLAGLNQVEARTLADTIRELNGHGLTIILIEHNLGEVMRTCPRLVVLDNGCLLAEGEAAAVMALPAVRAAYLGGTTDAA